MHFSTVNGNHGDQAHLESRLFYPKRGSQCLQFYLHNSGGADDQLNVWVREYDKANPKGKLRLIQKIDITGLTSHLSSYKTMLYNSIGCTIV